MLIFSSRKNCLVEYKVVNGVDHESWKIPSHGIPRPDPLKLHSVPGKFAEMWGIRLAKKVALVFSPLLLVDLGIK